MLKKNIFLIEIFLFLFLQSSYVFAAVGCSLNDPDRAVKRIFPQSTGLKTQFITIKEKGGKILQTEIEKKLGDKLDPIYEALDVPYAYYTVLKGTETIGRIHGVNQKGMYGGMQLILATDLNGKIMKLYYQRISSPEAKKFRSKSFTKQFKGFTLADFYHHDAMEGMECPHDKIAKIKDPSKKSHKDFKATLRGIKKNLILLDGFMLNNKYDEIYKKIKETVQKKKKKASEKRKEQKKK